MQEYWASFAIADTTICYSPTPTLTCFNWKGERLCQQSDRIGISGISQASFARTGVPSSPSAVAAGAQPWPVYRNASSSRPQRPGRHSKTMDNSTAHANRAASTAPAVTAGGAARHHRRRMEAAAQSHSGAGVRPSQPGPSVRFPSASTRPHRPHHRWTLWLVAASVHKTFTGGWVCVRCPGLGGGLHAARSTDGPRRIIDHNSPPGHTSPPRRRPSTTTANTAHVFGSLPQAASFSFLQAVEHRYMVTQSCDFWAVFEVPCPP